MAKSGNATVKSLGKALVELSKASGDLKRANDRLKLLHAQVSDLVAELGRQEGVQATDSPGVMSPLNSDNANSKVKRAYNKMPKAIPDAPAKVKRAYNKKLVADSQGNPDELFAPHPKPVSWEPGASSNKGKKRGPKPKNK